MTATERSPYGEPKEDRCSVCGALIGFGCEAFHLGRCKDCRENDGHLPPKNTSTLNDEQKKLLDWADHIAPDDRDEIHANGGAVVHIQNNHVVVKDDDGTLLDKVSFQDNPQDLAGFATILVQRLRGNRVPARLKTTKLVSCGICDHFHPTDFNGDCRDDGNRFVTPNDPEDEATHYDNGDPGNDTGDEEE